MLWPLPSRSGSLASVNMVIVLLNLAAFAVVSGVAVSICRIHRHNRIRKAQEKVYNDYLREQALLQANFFNTYFAMLQETQRHTNG